MFTITTCNGSWYTIVPTWPGIAPGIIIPDKGGSKVLHCGTPVETIPGENSLGDTSCIHSNIRGEYVLPPAESSGWSHILNPAVSSSTRITGAYDEYRKTVSPLTARVLRFFTKEGSASIRGWRYVKNAPGNKKWRVDSGKYYDFYCGTISADYPIRLWWRVNWYDSAYALTASQCVPYVYMVQTFWVELQDISTGTYTVRVKQDSNLHLSSPIITAPAWRDSTGAGTTSGGSYNCRVLPYGGDTYTKRDVYAVRDRILAIGQAHRYHYDTYAPFWDSLAWTCCNNMQTVSINSLAYVADLAKLCKAFYDVWHGDLSILAGLKDWTVKGLAKKWLSSRYGLRLTLSDTRSLIGRVLGADSGLNYPYSVVRAAEDWSAISAPSGFQTLHAKYKCFYMQNEDPIRALIADLWNWDIAPTLENIWDLVPLSFIFDWVLNIQERLKYLDNLNYLSCIKIGGTCKSFKTDVFPILLDGQTSTGLYYSYYRRISSPKLDDIRMPSLFPDHGRSINILDGLSLIISFLP